MKKKIFFIFIILILLAVACCITLYVRNLNFIKGIRNSFNDYVIINKDTNLYGSDHSIIGSVYKGSYFMLESSIIDSKDDTYFKIKDTDYYLFYGDVDKSEMIDSPTYKDYYVDLGKNISTDGVTNFYQNGELRFSINSSFNFIAKSMDNSFYNVSFLDSIYQIKIDEASSSDVEINGIYDYISVLNYNSVMDSCKSEDCVTTSEFKNQMNYLRENGFYSIGIEDYKLWLSGFINLKEKAILITSKQDIDSLSSEYGFSVVHNYDDLTFVDSNSKSERGNSTIPRYNIISKTTLDIFKKIASGESVTYVVVKPTQVHTLPSMSANATKIPVLNYHFFYDPDSGESCTDGNCKRVKDFERELAYLKENNYKSLTMDEFVKWMYGEIELPARSVLITIDDGAMGTGTHNGNKLNPILEKYQMHATLFLITGWWDINNYKSDYLDIESHTHNMHNGNVCKNQPRGSELLCSSREEVLEDLTTSSAITGSRLAFCFPMYVYNDTVMSVLKELDFKLAFVGGDYKASRSNDKLKVPRYHIYRDTTLDQFINMIS